MKQILLLLLLFPCLCLAQYTGNANQKITLGEQTTADGLVFRGVQNDTALITPLSDTSAYIILDTVNNKFYNYNRSTNVWSLAGGGVSVSSFSAGTTGLTPNTATTGAVTLGGTLAVTNGGTGQTTLEAANIVTKTGTDIITGFKTFSTDNVTDNITLLSPSAKLRLSAYQASGESIIFAQPNPNPTNVYSPMAFVASKFKLFGYTGDNKVELWTDNNLRLGIDAVGTTIITNLAGSGTRAVNASADGTLSAASSITIKENVNNLNYGLDKILQLQPKSFNYIDKNKYGEYLDIGFIAEDVYNIVPEATGTMNDGFIYFDAVKLIPILTKAIQEQNALIKALEQRILTLENK